MDSHTTIIGFLHKVFVNEDKVTLEEANEVCNNFKRQWTSTLGDCKDFTKEELKKAKIPAKVWKELEKAGFLKSSSMFTGWIIVKLL